jgi:PadR family transcriptional regulator PadR
MAEGGIRDHLDMLLLAVLAREPAHGYAAIEGLRRRSGDAFDLAEGTVYPALHRLERGGLTQSEWTAAAGRDRRVYRLTPAGRRILKEKRQEWEGFTAAVSRVLLEGSPG